MYYFIVCLSVTTLFYSFAYGSVCSDSPIPLTDIQIAVKASKAVYDDSLEVGNYILDSHFIVTLKVEKKIPIGDGDDNIVVIVAEHSGTTVVSFRGVKGLDQLVTVGLNSHGLEYNISNTIVNINKYFAEALSLVYNDTQPKLIDTSRKYIITGHSMGGALASLLALKEKLEINGSIWQNEGTSLITFGAPKEGNVDFANLHDDLIPVLRKLRFVYNQDPITRLPISNFWKHHSGEIYISREVVKWMMWKTTWRICNKDDNDCSSSKFSVIYLFHHKMDKYLDYILSSSTKGPKMFYDLNDKKLNNWKDAYKSSCENQN